MTPKKALSTIISLFLVLGLMAIIFPSDGIHISESLTLRFPSLTDIFPVADTTTNGKNDPEDEIRAMMEVLPVLYTFSASVIRMTERF